MIFITIYLLLTFINTLTKLKGVPIISKLLSFILKGTVIIMNKNVLVKVVINSKFKTRVKSFNITQIVAILTLENLVK